MRDSTLSQNNILITGTSSGLGKHLSQHLGGVHLTRQNQTEVFLDYAIGNGTFDTIIHCAFNSQRDVADWYQYTQDNIFLTQKLTQLPHKKFIFISSVDVYQEGASSYKLTKLMAESIVEKRATSPVVLRCSAMVGSSMRKNSLVKLLFEKKKKISLAGTSNLNYISQDDILKVILRVLEDNTTGVLDCVSSDSLSLFQINDKYKSEAVFGEYIYTTPSVSNAAMIQLCPEVEKTSEQVVEEFYKEFKK